MLTDEERADYRLRFLELIDSLDFDQERFLNYLESARVDFFNKPYNTYPEYAYAGSLCEYVIKTYDMLKRVATLYDLEYTDEQFIQVAVFKPLYRAELYEVYNKNQKDEEGNWVTVKAFRTKEERPIFGDIGFSSYMIAKKFIDNIDDEVVEAICYSSLGNLNNIDGYNIRKSYPLVTIAAITELALLHF